MNRPFVAVVVAYAIGILLARCFQPPLWLLIALAGLLFGGVLVLVFGFKRRSRFLVWPLLAFIAWANLVIRTHTMPPDDLRALIGPGPALAMVRGTLLETPRLRVVDRDQREIWRSMARVRVEAIQREDTVEQRMVPASGEVLAITTGVLSGEFFQGQKVELDGVIRRPDAAVAEGVFDFRDYLGTRGIFYEFKVDTTNDWMLVGAPLKSPPLTDRFLDWARGTLALGLPVVDEPLKLLWAMTLGWRTAFTGDISEPFLEAGTMHMFAIDGLRIALLSGMIVTLLRVLRLSRGWCGLIAAPIIWFYTAATGWEASAVRASVMMTIVLGGWALKRPPDLANSLAAAAFAILLWDPRQFFEASFQLSFFVMLVIALVLPPLNAWSDRCIDRWLKPDPLLPDELTPGWRKHLVTGARVFARFCGLAFTAWLGSLPLAARYFHLFSPVSTVANVFAVPLGSLALMANLGAIICGHWLAPVTGLFNNAAWLFMTAMTWVSVKFAALPGAYFYVPGPSITTTVIYYGAFVAAFSGWFKTARRRALGVTLLALIGGFYLWQWEVSRAETDLTVLPLDGGHAVYVDADGRKNDWLINCGNTNSADGVLKEFLRGQGVNFLPRLALADADARDCGGAGTVDRLFGVGELWTSGVKFRSAAYREAVAAFDGPTGGRRKFMNFGDTNGCWRVLYPAAATGLARAEDAPLVLLGHFHGTRILLLGNLSRDGQSKLLGLTNDLHADIVIAGLPEQSEPLCDDLIAAIAPRAIVIADSERPAAYRASPELHARLETAGVPVIYTRAAGAVKIVTRPAGWKVETMDGQTFSGEGRSEH
jgi:competence protein ComEC